MCVHFVYGKQKMSILNVWHIIIMHISFENRLLLNTFIWQFFENKLLFIHSLSFITFSWIPQTNFAIFFAFYFRYRDVSIYDICFLCWFVRMFCFFYSMISIYLHVCSSIIRVQVSHLTWQHQWNLQLQRSLTTIFFVL